jgi:hypothetical protein
MLLMQYSMVLTISPDRTLSETQQDFNNAWRYLRLDFYRSNVPGPARKHFNSAVKLNAAGLKKAGEIEINDTTMVGRLENEFLEKFGLHVQVSRQSGTIWLETTMTDSWTLKQQNDHGRELSEPIKGNFIIKEDDIDYD